ncbi:MAG: DUF4148 domain-containing protein [Pseudomonadota bacterium]|jgi:hypothetical protein|uniref:DUF4148 domain-containing protein n=1 Tax=Burkholderiaceae TaxID=119060 RepID=UPI0010F850D5|nr:DUF4148 domain-containing protein [Burkholderia sp. 4M9327F10]
MKSLIQAVVVAAALIAPALSFAQSNAPVTRAQVRADQKAGYHPGDDETHYPVAVQAAEARIAAQKGAASGYGGAVSGVSESGRSNVSPADWNAMYGRP